jgi:hypothetical protein
MLKLESVAIEKLIPYARNSRTHSDEQVAQIAASIKEFGFTNPVLIDGGGGVASLLATEGSWQQGSSGYKKFHAFGSVTSPKPRKGLM